MIREQARSASDALSQAFEVSLRARREKHPICGFDEGIVDVGMLGEYAVGAATADEIFMQEVAIDDRDCAVAVMIDCSGSMGSVGGTATKAHLARLTAAAMHEALARVQIAHEITGFTTLNSNSLNQHIWAKGREPEIKANFHALRTALKEEHARGVAIEKYARCVRGTNPEYAQLQVPFHAIFKSFASTDARGLTNVTGIDENLDGEAVMWQARRLTTRPEPRRIMFVLSDGMPLGSRVAAQGAHYLKECIDRVTAAGIEVYGVGIKSHHVKQFYERSWVANTLGELCDVAMGGMIEVLTEARQEHAWVQLTA